MCRFTTRLHPSVSICNDPASENCPTSVLILLRSYSTLYMFLPAVCASLLASQYFDGDIAGLRCYDILILYRMQVGFYIAAIALLAASAKSRAS